MKKVVVLFFAALISIKTNCQDFSANRLLDMLDYPELKLEKELRNKLFYLSGNQSSGDTLTKVYEFHPAKFKKNKKKQTDSIERRFIKKELNKTFSYTYQTTSPLAYNLIINDLRAKGFYCDYENDSLRNYSSYLYQHEDYAAAAFTQYDDGKKWLSITTYKKILPVTKNISFAEDLLEFTSHEYLVYYFGEKNVKKDVYYFANNDIVNCSVLFINTKRQAIFIWRDGLNRCGLDNILIGGLHKLKSQEKNENFIEENDWYIKSGVHSGMSIFELRALNGKSFSFSGGNSPNPGVILQNENGSIDFGNKDVILGCMNCTDDKFSNAEVVDADNAIMDGKIIFVLTIVLYPLIRDVYY